jgi:hypothetical protein
MVADMQRMIDSRRLRPNHFLYKYLRNLAKAVRAKTGNDLKWDREIYDFCATLLYYGGGHVINLLRGSGFDDRGFLNVDFDRFNFVLPSLASIIKNRPAYTVEAGTRRCCCMPRLTG